MDGTDQPQQTRQEMTPKTSGHALVYIGVIMLVFIVASAYYIFISGKSTPSNTTIPSSSSTVVNAIAATSSTTSATTTAAASVAGYIYCVGGLTHGLSAYNTTYYAPLYLGGGIGKWTLTTSPYGKGNLDCNAYNNYVYCVDGNISTYASLSSNGVGSWSNTTETPNSTNTTDSCAIYNGYIYCLQVDKYITKKVQPSFAYYAPVSSSGIGPWKQTTKFPVSFEPPIPYCQAYDGYFYCLGGSYNSSIGINNNTYYAPITSSGIGSWTRTTRIPFSLNQTFVSSCNIYNGYIYCPYNTTITYYAPVGSFGIGAFKETTGSGIDINPSNMTQIFVLQDYDYCLGDNGILYCPGAYYAEKYAHINSNGSLNAFNFTSPYPETRYFGSCVTS
ncbi:MAG: hypothetical protein LVQ95_02995 [Candidatus Micrarchaeales archaeon]|nr:hypothetical protein [Candidatus Micrarchaeales archaeon]